MGNGAVTKTTGNSNNPSPPIIILSADSPFSQVSSSSPWLKPLFHQKIILKFQNDLLELKMQVMDSPTTQLNIFASAQKNAHLKIRFSHSQVTASSQRSLHYSFSLQLDKTYFFTSIKLLRLYNLIKLSSKKLTFLIGLKSIRLA